MRKRLRKNFKNILKVMGIESKIERMWKILHQYDYTQPYVGSNWRYYGNSPIECINAYSVTGSVYQMEQPLTAASSEISVNRRAFSRTEPITSYYAVNNSPIRYVSIAQQEE